MKTCNSVYVISLVRMAELNICRLVVLQIYTHLFFLSVA
jgi:hypothetical protein